MSKPLLVALAALAVGGGAQAQEQRGANVPAGRAPPRARSPSLDLALEAAQAALAACQAKGYKPAAIVFDSSGATVVSLLGDGASPRGPLFAGFKAATSLRYKVASGVIMDRVKAEPALAAEVKADPTIGVAHQGGLPIMVGGELIGAIAVSGSPGGDKDEACAKIGLDKVAARLK